MPRSRASEMSLVGCWPLTKAARPKMASSRKAATGLIEVMYRFISGTRSKQIEVVFELHIHRDGSAIFCRRDELDSPGSLNRFFVQAVFQSTNNHYVANSSVI